MIMTEHLSLAQRIEAMSHDWLADATMRLYVTLDAIAADTCECGTGDVCNVCLAKSTREVFVQALLKAELP